ncbi:MAG TPA: amidohydrolase family protein [Candidatus Lokiarchaeia archaeon]|nr:amidohydrolase family protein [Candidatus Lokiarchaeia archaeon]
MPYFANLREHCSSFYQRLWNELEQVKIIDTHEHWRPPNEWAEVIEKTGFMLPEVFNGSYLYLHPSQITTEGWLKQIHRYAATGYMKGMLWAIEDLYGLEPPVTVDYLEHLDALLKEAYQDDPWGHVKEIIENRMHVEVAIQDIDIDTHLEMSQRIPAIHAAAGIPTVLSAIQVPRKITPASGILYRFAAEHLGMQPDDFHGLDDYCIATDKMLEYFKSSGNYICLKNQCAYWRPLYFPEPDEDKKIVERLFNAPVKDERDVWKFGDYMFHHVLEWISLNWKVPVQMHTGIARMLFGDSNALNMSHMFEKFPDLKFDLFHGNYPFNNLGGMLHQIPNVCADLCWLPLASPTACQRALLELIELGSMAGLANDTVPVERTSVYGGDCHCVEGSYGALLMAKDVVIRTIEELHERGHVVSEADAIDLAEQVLHESPKKLFCS